MGDLVGAFDFESPDFSVVELPDTPEPHKNSKGDWDGSSHCQSQHQHIQPPVPYTGEGAIEDMETVVNDGFKSIRGKLTEGRYLVFELLGAALTAQKCGSNKRVNLTPATAKHEKKSQRFIVHADDLGGEDFTITSVASGDYICSDGKLCSSKDDAVTFTITFAPSKGYSLMVKETGKFLGANSNKSTTFESGLLHWQVYSVNY